MEHEKPNWSKWNYIGDTELWKVAYLSLDINPDVIRYGKYISGIDKWQSEIETGFIKRLEIIESNYDEIQGHREKSATDASYWKINIPKFAEWAISVNLTIPDELKSRVQNLDLGNTENSLAESQVELGIRETQLEIILAIITALDFEPLEIPDGGKAKIRKVCLTRPKLFTTSSFDHAWKDGNRLNLFRMANRDKYTSSKK